MTTDHTRPKGPHGIAFDLAEKIREHIRRGDRFHANIAEQCGVSLETVRRVSKNMHNRERRARRAAERAEN